MNTISYSDVSPVDKRYTVECTFSIKIISVAHIKFPIILHLVSDPGYSFVVLLT